MSEKKKNSKGFSLIELMVAIFIAAVIFTGIVAVFVSSTSSYQKSKAMKRIFENTQYALSLIVKDIRMGKIESGDGTLKSQLAITRNRGGKVCYKVASDYLAVDDSAGDCTGAMKNLVDLNGTNMTFRTATSGFYSRPTDMASAAKMRGWAEINLEIIPGAGKEMEAEPVRIQTAVSSRDYGWEEVP